MESTSSRTGSNREWVQILCRHREQKSNYDTKFTFRKEKLRLKISNEQFHKFKKAALYSNSARILIEITVHFSTIIFAHERSTFGISNTHSEWLPDTAKTFVLASWEHGGTPGHAPGACQTGHVQGSRMSRAHPLHALASTSRRHGNGAASHTGRGRRHQY